MHQPDLARLVIGKGFPQWVHHAGGKYAFAGGDSEQPDTRMITYEYGDMTLTVEHTEWTPTCVRFRRQCAMARTFGLCPRQDSERSLEKSLELKNHLTLSFN